METFVNQIKSVSSKLMPIPIYEYLYNIIHSTILNKLSKLLTFISKKSFFFLLLSLEMNFDNFNKYSVKCEDVFAQF